MKSNFCKQRVLAWIVQTAPDENDDEMSLAEIVPICAPEGYALFKNLGESPKVSIIPENGPIWAVYPIQDDGDVHPTPIGYSEVAPSEPHEPDWPSFQSLNARVRITSVNLPSHPSRGENISGAAGFICTTRHQIAPNTCHDMRHHHIVPNTCHDTRHHHIVPNTCRTPNGNAKVRPRGPLTKFFKERRTGDDMGQSPRPKPSAETSGEGGFEVFPADFLPQQMFCFWLHDQMVNILKQSEDGFVADVHFQLRDNEDRQRFFPHYQLSVSLSNDCGYARARRTVKRYSDALREIQNK